MRECRHGASGAEQSGSIVDHYLKSEYASFDQEHRKGGTFGLTLIDVQQGAIEVVDPPVSDVCIVRPRNVATLDFDFGDGWQHKRTTPSTVDIQPAFQACAFCLPPLSLTFVAANAEMVTGLLGEVGAAPDALESVTGQFRELSRAANVIDRLWKAMNSEHAGSTLLSDGLFMTLIGELLEASGKGRLPASLPGSKDLRLIRAVDYIEAHLDTAFTVGDLARVATMSRSGFARAFSNAYGEPVWSYVQGRRILRAMEMLRCTAMPIAQVADQCGFATQSHLTNAMRIRMGVTPGAVRRS